MSRLLCLRTFCSLAVCLLVFAGCAGSKTAAVKPMQPAVQQRLSEKERLALAIGRMHFDNGDYAMARKEYVRLVLNHPGAFVKEVAQFMIGESFYRENDCPQAARYFQHYILEFPSGYRRAESDVRLQQCEEQRLHAENRWTTGKLRQLEQPAPPQPSMPELSAPAPQSPSFTDADLERARYRTTWYWIENEAEYKRENLQPLLDPQEREIARVPAAFLKRVLIEGTGRLRDGRLVNWAAPQRFMVVDERSPFGLGAQGYSLVPFRTIAVDRQQIPLGTVLYIKEFEGVRVSQHERHDGCFIAGDVGSAIRGQHIDLFAPTYQQALRVMQQVPEKVVLRQAASHCRDTYNVSDGYALSNN